MSADPAATFVLDDPDNHCFGCSPHNRRGMRMAFTRRGPGLVEAFYTAEAHFAGAPGVVHGGVQAVLLDEIIGVAIHEAHDEPETLHIVTVDFALRYRRPVPTGRTVLLRGTARRREGCDHHASGEIRGLDGELLTGATARWRRIDADRRAAAPAAPRAGAEGLNARRSGSSAGPATSDRSRRG